MQKFLLLLFFAGIGLTVSAQVVLEDFEGGMADLAWEAVNGTYDGAIDNPNDTTSNPSAFVGSYTKSGEHAFSLLQATLDAPLDLSTNNRFEVQINAGAATELILKLEGGGDAIEKRVNITTEDVWRTYSFDFSGAAGFTAINTIVMIFDPGVEESADTYLFDNLTVNPADDCAGTVEDVTIIDNFECQRNAAYRGGFDDIRVVDNPDPSGINTSAQVGEYTDQMGPFAALAVNYDDGIDLSVNNYFCIDVWAPVAGNLLVKLEGGVSLPVEVPNQIETTMEWTQVCVDFSGQAAADHSQITFFFNAGENGEGDIYYVDNITRTPAPAAEALEDFEDGANLNWGPANGNAAVNGTFNGVVDNPSTGGDNSSENVGSYTRGGTNFSTLSAELTTGLDLTINPQINLDVLMPPGSSSVTMQLVSALDGVKSVTVETSDKEGWQTLNFSFESFSDVTDFFQVNLLFDPMTTGTETYLFDNLAQGQSTVDGCADVPTNPDILDDFECQRNANYTCCGEIVTAVNNPDVTAANPSLRVGAFVDPPGAFDALVIDNGGENPFGFEVKNQLNMKVWAPVAGQILFKLEGGTSPDVEIFQDITATMEWVNYVVDLSPYAGQGHTRLVFFFGAGTENTEPNTYFIDDIVLARSPFTMDCVTTFESNDITINGWMSFANGAREADEFVIVDNPDVSAGNMSASVGSFVEAVDGEPFAGITGLPIAPVILPMDNQTMSLDIWMPVAGTVVFKLEQGRDEAMGSGDIAVEYTTPGEWATLTFDFSASAYTPGGVYERVTLIPNFGVVPTEDLTHYFDNISAGGAMCGTTSIAQPTSFAELQVYPNPVLDQLTIENTDEAIQFDVHNLLGQRVKTLRAGRFQERVQYPVADLARGTYVLTARDVTGRVVARTKFIKR